MRQKLANLRIQKRSAGLIAAVMIIAGGVAFAMLQSQAKLAGNSVQTESAGLLISDTDSNYTDIERGFAFAHIIPGAQASQTEHFLLKNTGSAALALKLGATSLPVNPGNVDLSKVNIILTPYNENFMPGASQTFTLQSLIDGNTGGGLAVSYPAKLTAGAKEEFNIQVSMDGDAASGSSASLSNIDLGFTGVAAANAN
jgi:hypothetical protein